MDRSILVVDDDESSLKLMTRILSRAFPDITILTADTGAGGIQTAASHQPEVILLDVMLPDTTGMDVCRLLRANVKTRNIPILMITGQLTDHRDKIDGLDAGADAYVFKPFQHDEFIAQIRVMLRIKRSEDLLRKQKTALENAFHLQTLELAEKKSALEVKVGLLEERLATRTQELIREDNLSSDRLLATGMAHEINNPNTFIASNLATFKTFWTALDKTLETHQCQTDEERKQIQFIRAEMPGLISGMQSGTERISRIIWRMKGLAKDILSDARVISPATIVDAACELTRHQVPQNVEFIRQTVDGLPKVYGSEDMLVQALVNIILNAVHAVEDSGRAGEILVRTAADAQNGVQVEVSDTGTGITPQDLEKVFSPFFTTRRDKGGTGLGLFFTYGVIKGHRGTLTVHSRLGEGTTFTMRLPAAKRDLPRVKTDAGTGTGLQHDKSAASGDHAPSNGASAI